MVAKHLKNVFSSINTKLYLKSAIFHDNKRQNIKLRTNQGNAGLYTSSSTSLLQTEL